MDQLPSELLAIIFDKYPLRESRVINKSITRSMSYKFYKHIRVREFDIQLLTDNFVIHFPKNENYLFEVKIGSDSKYYTPHWYPHISKDYYQESTRDYLVDIVSFYNVMKQKVPKTHLKQLTINYARDNIMYACTSQRGSYTHFTWILATACNLGMMTIDELLLIINQQHYYDGQLNSMPGDGCDETFKNIAKSWIKPIRRKLDELLND